MEDPPIVWAMIIGIFAFMIIAGTLRMRKMAQMRRTMLQRENGLWEWTDRKGGVHVSDENPLEAMKRDGKEAEKSWRVTHRLDRD